MRVSTSAMNAALVRYMQTTQDRVFKGQEQLASEKVSSDYAGIASYSRQAITAETTVTQSQRYLANNEALASKMEAAQTSLTAIETTIQDFYEQLNVYKQNSPTEESTEAIQDAAFRALLDLQDYLNTDYLGQRLFAGTDTTSNAVTFPYASLEDFQDTYDGVSVLYPVFADADLANVTTSNADTGDLTLSSDSTITAANAGSLANIPVGSTITLSGSTTDDGVYTVVDNDGTTITISGTISGTDVAVNATLDTNGNETVAATLSTTTYYTGDNDVQTYRIDRSASVEFDISAADPAIEKAFRAIAIIAQGGGFEEEGSLDQNLDRVTAATALLSDALNEASDVALPYGDEAAGSLDREMATLGYAQVRVQDKISQQTTDIALLQSYIAELENIDLTEVAVKLQDDMNALQISYAVISEMQNLSLTDYL